MGYTPEAIAGRKLTEASRMRTQLLHLETSMQRLEAWGGSEIAISCLANAIAGLLVAIAKLEVDANEVIDARAAKVAAS